jgi:hypothetical protein
VAARAFFGSNRLAAPWDDNQKREGGKPADSCMEQSALPCVSRWRNRLLMRRWMGWGGWGDAGWAPGMRESKRVASLGDVQLPAVIPPTRTGRYPASDASGDGSFRRTSVRQERPARPSKPPQCHPSPRPSASASPSTPPKTDRLLSLAVAVGLWLHANGVT